MAKIQKEKMNPDQVILNPIQQKRLASIAGVNEKEMGDKNIVEASEFLKWRIPPHLFRFERICGRVVKKDPITGQEYPVPFATVYVEDTDCNIIVYHPVGYPWCWHYPLFCHREIIGTTQTDACGNFCVWVPRFDIDWILRWRRERFCFPIIFKRPELGDIVKQKWPPIPDPNPDPWERFSSVLNSIEGTQATFLKNKIAQIKSSASFGGLNTDVNELSGTRLFDREVPPPLPADFQKALSGQNIVASKNASASEGVRSAIGRELGLQLGERELEGFDHLHFKGPFFRCIDLNVPVWQRVVDVPDITFRVTQDTNGDGVEETIYSEGYFDVRWDSGPISNVKLVASSIAKESRYCHTPHVPCGDTPAILFAGFMPLTDVNYFQNGYALRPNRPRTGGTSAGAPTFPAQTPLCYDFPLNGCVDVQNAKYYRIKDSFNGGTSSAITGVSWHNFLAAGGLPIPIVADVDGWYPVEPINPITLSPVPRVNLEFPNLLLPFGGATGINDLTIEIGDNSKNVIATSATVRIVIDNEAPHISSVNISWKYDGESDASLRTLDLTNCPMIQRGAVARKIELVFQSFVSANHLRDASLGTSGCGGGAFYEIGSTANNEHWYETPLDNAVTLSQRYALDASSKAGCYNFGCTAISRSINPSGIHNEYLIPTPDWFVDEYFIYSPFNVSVAVVDEDES
jgi:hypothetical protein